jgi:GNAT superfamily N-acetyltransferase
VIHSGARARLREATAADVEVILHQRRGMFADMGEGDAASLDAMTDATRPILAAALRDGSYRGWLAEVDAHVVAGGGVALLGFQPTPVDLSPHRAWIVNIYTEPAFRRQGLAKLVMRGIIDWCRAEGLTMVRLHASDAGRPLYESMGFEPTNEMRLVL